MQLKKDQFDFFSSNGYLSLGKVFSDDEVLLFRNIYDRLVEKALLENSYTDLTPGNQNQTESNEPNQIKMLQIFQMCEQDIAFRKLLFDDRILAPALDLLGPDIMLLHDQALNKPAKHGAPVHWHQDNAYWDLKPATAISCWLTLDDVQAANGAMQFIPGSHNELVQHESVGPGSQVLQAVDIDKEKAVVVALPAGGVVFHHCQTLHYTGPNETDHRRRALAIHLVTPETKRKDGTIIPVSFSNPILRKSLG